MKQQSTSKGFAVLGASTILIRVLSLIYIPIQTAIMKNDGNFVISAGVSLYALIYQLTNIGLPSVISKMVSERNALGDYRGARRVLHCAFLLMAALGVAAMFFTYFGAGALADYVNYPQAKLMFQVIAPTFLFSCVSSSLRGYYQGRRNMVPTALSQLIEQLLNTVFTVVFVYTLYRTAQHARVDPIPFGAAGSAVGTVLGAIGSALFLAFLFSVAFRPREHREIHEQTFAGPSLSSRFVLREMLRFAAPAVVGTLAAQSFNLIDAYTVQRGLMQGGFAAQAANALSGIYFNQYGRLETLAIAFATPLVTALLPAVAAARVQSDYGLVRRRVRESYRLLYTLTIPIVVGMMFLAKPLISLIFVHINDGEDLVIFGMWTAVLQVLTLIQAGLLTASGSALIGPLNTVVGVLPKILCNVLLVPVHGVGAKGAIIGSAAGWLCTLVLNDVAIRRRLHTGSVNLRYARAPVFSSLVMGAVCMGVYHLLYLPAGLRSPQRINVLASDAALLVAVAVGVLLYFTLMIKLGAVTRETIRRLPMGTRILALLCRLPFLRGELAPRGG